MVEDENTKNPSGLSEFFNALSKEKAEARQKIKEKIADPESGLSSLFQQLEEALQETKNVSVEEDSDNTKLSADDQNKLDVFSNLLNELGSDKETPNEVEPEEILPEEFVAENEEPIIEIIEPQDDIVSNVIRNLDDMKEKTQVKEEVEKISSIQKEFDNFRSFISQQIASLQMSGAGSGEVRLEFLDDVDRDTAKVNNKYLKYNSTTGKWAGADASGSGTSDEEIQDVVGAMFTSNTETGITATYQDGDGTIDLVVGTLNQDTTGNAATATALETARTIGMTGDVVWTSASFDGSGNVTGSATIQANSVDGTMIALGSDASGDVMYYNGTNYVRLGKGDDDQVLTLASGVPSWAAAGGTSNETIQDVVGAMFTSNTETGITATYEDGDGTIDLVVGTLNQDTTGNAATATALETARTIGGTSFDGTANIAVALAATATALASARTIGGVSFDGTANINLPGVNTSGSQDTSGTAAIATTVTITDNESTDEDNAIIFTAGGDVDGGNLGLESDGTLTYNPSTGKVTATGFVGTLTGDVTGNTSGTAATVTTAAQTNITSLGTLTALTVDDVVINGATIGHGDDTDLITVADGVLTVAGELDATTLDISGNADIDGTLEADAYTVDGTALNEYIADTVGAMVSSNTETGITVTYQDGDNTIDFVVGTLNQDTTGTAAKVTVTDSTANTNFPIVFHDESNALLDDTGALRYNPSTGELLVPNLTVAGTTTQVDTVTMQAANAVVFEGATADAHETTLSVVDPTGDHTQYLINQGGYVPLLAAATTTAITSTPEELNILDGATVVVSEINALDLGSTAVGNAIASKAVILDSNKDYTGLRNLTITGELDAATLDISGNADIDGTLEADAYTVDGTTLAEYISDTVGAMVSSNTETGITVTYQDGDNTIDFVVGTLNQDTTGTAATVTTAAQPNITSLGTLTTLTVDNIIINGTNIGHTSDTDAIAIASDGVVTFSQTPVFSSDVTVTDDIYLDSDGAVIHFGDDGEVTLTHVHNQGLRMEDSDKLTFGAGDDLELYHDGSNSYIKDSGTGALISWASANYIRGSSGEDMIKATTGGAVEAYYANAKKFETTSGGGTLTGSWAVTTSLNPDASDGATLGTNALEWSDLYIADGGVIYFGDDQDVQLEHVADTGLRFPDGDKLIFGAGNDLTLHHDGSNSYISDAGTGNLYVLASVFAVNNAANSAAQIIATDGGAVELYHNGSKKINTESTGATLTGVLALSSHLDMPDSAKVKLGTGDDLNLYHDGTNSYIDNTTGGTYMRTNSTENAIVAEANSGVIVYYDGSEKFRTTSAGATVTGVLTATLQANAIDSDHYVDGSIDAAHYADNSISTAKIGDDQITEAKMANDAVGSAELKTLSTLLIKNSGGTTLATFHTAGA